MFIDEAGFYLLPAAVRTYAPRGQTPILRVPLTWDHLSAISAITPDGRLLMMIQKEAFNGTTIVRFLKHLLRHMHGKLLIIWDGLPAHHGQAVKNFLRQGAAHLEAAEIACTRHNHQLKGVAGPLVTNDRVV